MHGELGGEAHEKKIPQISPIWGAVIFDGGSNSSLDNHPPSPLGEAPRRKTPSPPEPRCDPCHGRVRNEPKMLTLSNTLFFGTWHLFDETSISTKGQKFCVYIIKQTAGPPCAIYSCFDSVGGTKLMTNPPSTGKIIQIPKYLKGRSKVSQNLIRINVKYPGNKMKWHNTDLFNTS